MSNKAKDVFWGVLLLICAALIVVDKLGYLGGFSAGRIILGVLFAALLVRGIVRLRFGEILFPLAFLAILFDKPLGITALTPWTVLFVALLGTIALNLLFGKSIRRVRFERGFHTRNKEVIIEEVPGERTQFREEKYSSSGNDRKVKLEVTFGSGAKYINAAEFEQGKVECDFGQAEIYFDNAGALQGEAELRLECAFGHIIVHVPHEWIVKEKISQSFGGYQNTHVQPNSGPVLNIRGEVSFGSIEIVNA